MKRVRIYLVGLVVSLVVFNCDDILKVIDINFVSEPVSIDVYAKATTSGEYVDTAYVITSEIKDEIEKHDGAWEDAATISISSIHVNNLSGAQDFDALENFELKIQAADGTEKLVAWHNNIPLNVNEFTPEFTSDNLVNYILEDSYKVVFSCLIREDMTDDVTFTVTIEYNVEL